MPGFNPWLMAAAMALSSAAQALPMCSATSAPTQLRLVELYTSEGCSSCPPANRWLSGLLRRADVLPLAFHVDYWDRLGWVDRFASPQYTARQAQQIAPSGARFAYTPQVLVNGRDWRGAPALPPAGAKALVQIALTRAADDTVAVSVTALAGAPQQLGLWWVRVDDGHVTQVQAGENQGVQLKHDAVVREYGQLAAWRSQAGQPHQVQLPARPPADAAHPGRWIVAVIDSATGLPLQAVQLAC